VASVWNRIDSGLALVYANFLKVREQGSVVVRAYPVVEKGLKLHVTLYYSGGLGPLSRLGLKSFAITVQAAQAVHCAWKIWRPSLIAMKW
jgi:hypothetical protein